VQLVEPFAIEGRPVSSTWIRDLLDAGQVRQAGGFLGRPYALQGTVVPGHGRGRRLGVPTANVALPPEKLIPAPGVYAARAHLGNGSWVAAVNIGVAPTFGASALGSVEAHLDGFEGDLYGQTLALDLLERLRGEERFSGPEALAAQIGLDLAAARRLAGPGGNTQSS
jgi:riboflavin kinase/FMN adenylyltransferase